MGEEKFMAESLKVVNDFVFRIIHESIEKKEVADDAAVKSGETSTPPAPKDLISLFLSSPVKENEHWKANAFQSEAALIRDTLVNFIFAGKDTTPNSMSFFIVAINQYPEVLVKIRSELREKLPVS